MKLHKLSKDQVNKEGLLWLVAVRDTVDYRRVTGEVLKERIVSSNPKAIIKKGEIVWCVQSDMEEELTISEELYKFRIVTPLDNYFCINYKSEDFRFITQEEKEEYLK